MSIIMATTTTPMDNKRMADEFGGRADIGHAREFAMLRLWGSVIIAFAILVLAVALLFRGGEDDPRERSLSHLLAERGGTDFAYSSSDGAVSVSVRSLGFEAGRDRSGNASLFGRVTAVVAGTPRDDIGGVGGSTIGSGYIVIGRVVRHLGSCSEEILDDPECNLIFSAHDAIRDSITGAGRIAFQNTRVYQDDGEGTYTCGHYRIYRRNQFLPDANSVFRPFISPGFGDFIPIVKGFVYIDSAALTAPALSENERRVLGHPCFASR
ncbi:MAG: hypothetical protein MPK06_01285 [Alphaproteobacteria bacterium]|nr:hypothetical protein [Alphaproteobacteria bacterium]MDA8004137.1 hypothetical protein [Alphaproteobacteria bacterium]MDA8005165.1 hypothetical protein [Alphaproteobacteria bacterium]MDA8012627.1 hypothetical protein [Alphaproteobacteria bacterium]